MNKSRLFNRLPKVASFFNLIFILNLLAGCGQAHRVAQQITEVSQSFLSSRIIGGEAVQQDDPYRASTVDLYFGRTQPDVSNFCTGTLIAPKVVLTAGHCFADFSKMQEMSVEELKQYVYVGFGSDVVKSTNDSKVVFRKVVRVVVHPEYKVDSVRRAMKEPMQDLSILELDEAAPETAHPAQVVTDKEILQPGLVVDLVGFGVTSTQPRFVRATQLMKVSVSVDNPSITTAQFTYKNIGNHSACSGDSGGPAYLPSHNGEPVSVIGVTSWGDRSCAQMGAYTSVPAFSEWILETTQQLSQ